MCDTKESIIHARTSVIMGFWVEMDGLERTRFEKIGEKKVKWSLVIKKEKEYSLSMKAYFFPDSKETPRLIWIEWNE